ncbi:protein translocase subunit SecF [Nocardioides sp. Soil805]|uniref:protein translocase subunit SecF n=1 Tax=Nocardioides sp. Soil805 TaxID=1736416 RepID=UPI0007027AC7|nr:protein translocase subunit SecF [Nocardioides sp. Soil805]KRF36166.1 preprotein translocase subunit SecF [Nocardioides sp. Soil805]
MGAFSRLGNELYTGKRSIDFVGRRWLWYAVSALIVAVAVLGLWSKGLNMGIEFTGGAEYRVTLPADQVTQDTADELRTAVAGSGVESASAPVVTTSGSEAIIVQTEPVDDAESQAIVTTILDTTGASSQDISQTEIGPSWGKEVAQRSLLGLAVFLVLVVLFIWAYFREWKMSVAAIVALAHDVLITVGVYALSGFEVSPATVTGLLTILGFSLYDTVVVFDKVRENTHQLRKSRLSYAEAANLAVNQTLVRSINTSIVALIPVAAILYVGVAQLGSGSLKDLALALFVGMAAGAYSSIFIATPLLVQLKAREKDVDHDERRAAARRREAAADPYARVSAADRDATPPPDPRNVDADGTVRRRPVTAPPRRQEAYGKGRVAPPAHGPVKQSAASGRVQPTRQSRSKRGRK